MPTAKQILHGFVAGLLGAIGGALAPYTNAAAVKACLVNHAALLGCVADAKATAAAGAVAFIVLYIAKFPSNWNGQDRRGPQ